MAGRDLRNGHTQSCGCMLGGVKHGGRRVKNTDRLYYVWRGMISRCRCESASGYKYYGGKGVSVCQEWLTYSAFRQWAYNNGYDENAEQWSCTIDRIDPNGDYSPENCRWVGMDLQNSNKSKSTGH